MRPPPLIRPSSNGLAEAARTLIKNSIIPGGRLFHLFTGENVGRTIAVINNSFHRHPCFGMINDRHLEAFGRAKSLELVLTKEPPYAVGVAIELAAVDRVAGVDGELRT